MATYTPSQDVLVSGTNIKTVNSTSLLGSGDIAISGALADGDKGDIVVSGSGATWTIDSAVVTEAKMVTADNTTNDVSTTKHGFAPKAPNTAHSALLGTGAWSSFIDKYVTATAGSNGDFYVTLTGTIATNDIVYINFPTATNSASAARLSVNGGTNYYAIKVGSTQNALDVQGKKLSLYFDGTYFIAIDENAPTYAQLMGSSGYQELTTSYADFKKYNAVTGGGGYGTTMTATLADGLITCNFNGYIEVSGRILFQNASTKNVSVQILVNGTEAFSLFISCPSSGYHEIVIPPTILSVTSGQTVKLAVCNFTDATGNAGYSTTDSKSSNIFTVKRL